MQNPNVLVVIPTYNEKENIDTLLTRIRSAFEPAHILVVDDNSPDGTADLAESAGKRLGSVEVMRRPGKNGLGSAYRDGFRWGMDRGYDVLIEMDADFSHDPNDVGRLVATLVSEEADLVIGSRKVPGGAIPGWAAHRVLLSSWGNLYARLMLGLHVQDLTAGFRAYRAEILEKIELETVRANGYGFQIEMAYRVAKSGGRIREIPVVFVDRAAGDSKMSGAIMIEALRLVTKWGIRDRWQSLRGSHRKNRDGVAQSETKSEASASSKTVDSARIVNVTEAKLRSKP